MRWLLILALSLPALAQNTTGSAATGSFTIGILACDVTTNYACASTSTANPGLITAPFISTAPTATTCSPAPMCQNGTQEDMTIPGHVAGTFKITRISDPSTIPSGASTNISHSGGANDHMISPNGTYLWYALTGGSVNLAHFSIATGKVQVVNTGLPLSVNPHGGFSTSSLVDTRFYFTDSTRATIIQGDLTSDTAFTQTTVVNLQAACAGYGLPNPVTSNSIFNVSANDDTFTLLTGPGNQGSADVVVSWSRTKGCTVANFHTGNVYCDAGWGGGCSGGLLGTFANNSTTCWGSQGGIGSTKGIHAIQANGNGATVAVDVGPSGNNWTKGGCNGDPLNELQFAIWTMGTLTNVYAHGGASADNTCAFSNHPSQGISRTVTNDFYNGPAIQTTATPCTYTTFATRPNTGDIHCSWPHNNNGTYDDTLPVICATDLVTTGGGSAGIGNCPLGTSAVYCPNYFSNSIVVEFPNAGPPPGLLKTVAHTFECGDGAPGHAACSDGISDLFQATNAIGIVSPKGNIYCWVSTMLHQLGNDNTGKPRADVFCIYMASPLGSSSSL